MAFFEYDNGDSSAQPVVKLHLVVYDTGEMLP